MNNFHVFISDLHAFCLISLIQCTLILFCRLPIPRPKILGYVENVEPQYSSDEQFRRLFRMSGDTFENLLSYLKGCEELPTKGYGGRTPITVRKQLMIKLWYLGGLDPITRIADRFGVSESSIILCRNRVMIALPKVISWPTGEKLQSVVTKFSERNNFPGIVGAVDDTHIKIRAPDDHPQSYVNRKKIHCICNADMEFIYYNVGFLGSCHSSAPIRPMGQWLGTLQRQSYNC